MRRPAPRPRVASEQTRPAGWRAGERREGMIEEETTGSTDREALLLAMERRDPERALGFYADDAELRVVNGDLPGSPEFGLRGRAEIGRYLRAVFDNDAPRRIEVEV